AFPLQEKARVELQADRTAYAPGEQVRLTTTLHIDKGWHVNSNKPTYEYLIPTAIEVQLPAGWAAPALTSPPGELARFTFAEEELSVYQGDVNIVAAFQVPATALAGDAAATVKVTYQACNDTQCLAPV